MSYMAYSKVPYSLFPLFFTFVLLTCLTQAQVSGFRIQEFRPSQSNSHFQVSRNAQIPKNSRRLMIGSTAPTCTYNECRGCKYKCRAEQVPVEGNDPINSPYHYKCVCHR